MLALTAVIAVGVGLRCRQLTARSFWFDEAFSWRLTEFSWFELIQRISQDNHPPLYFLCLKCWSGLFGTSVLALRLLSVMLGCITILGMYLFGREAFGCNSKGSQTNGWRGSGIGLLIGLFVAVSAFQIRWSWEVRMYSLGTALAAFSSWALFRALHDHRQRIRPWVLYATLTLSFAYTHYYAWLTIASQAIFILGYVIVQAHFSFYIAIRATLFRNALLAGILVVLGYLPWVPFFLTQRHQVQEHFWIRPISILGVVEVFYKMLINPLAANPPLVDAWLVAVGCGAGLLMLAWKAQTSDWYVFCSAVIPVVLSVLISVFDTRIFNAQYFLFAHLFILVALAVLLFRISWLLKRAACCVIAVATLLTAYEYFWLGLDIANKPGGRAAAEFIVKNRNSGDPVVVCSPPVYLSVLYHASDRRDWYVYNAGRPFLHYEGRPVLIASDQKQDHELRVITSHRVWVVEQKGGAWKPNQVPVPPNWIEKGSAIFPEVYRMQGWLIVREYEVRTP